MIKSASHSLRTLPKVSVLIPAFNEEKYILQTLKALVNQDYPNFEIIVADNASSDRTAVLVEKFIRDHEAWGISIRLTHEYRRGTNFARESARRLATGSVIAQLDADCIPPEKWLRIGVTFLCASNKKRVAVTGPYDYFDSNRWMRFSTLISQKIIYPLINSLVQSTGKAAILIGGNAFIRAEVLNKIGGYNTDLTFYGDDIDLGKKLAAHGRVDFMPALIQQSSSRRYKVNGFWEVNKKYQSCFWDLVWGNNLQTAESSHPR
jgi:cellulose synthase/poly-beta-1,6-N-acetylglucosamine synthase-like glycosyltransferase